MQNEGKIAILDVSSYIFRAFHALPPMTSPDGKPVNAIYGFINMFLRTISKFEGIGGPHSSPKLYLYIDNELLCM